MTTPTRPSATVESRSGAWIDGRLERVEGVARLSSEQPDHGLVWVTRGHLLVRREDGPLLEVAQGSVVAYRLGDGLTWTAGPGTHVRWCWRDVRLAEGQAEAWTPSKAAEDESIAAAPRRRPWFSLAAIVLVWIGAAAVAWCYGNAHTGLIKDEQDRLAALAPKIEGAEADMEVAAAHFEKAGFHVISKQAFLKGKPPRVALYVATASEAEATALSAPDGALAALGRTLVNDYFGAHERVKAIEVFPSRPDSNGVRPWGRPVRILSDGTVTLERR